MAETDQEVDHSRIQALRALSFGARVAEEERDVLSDYFVETELWNSVRSGQVDGRIQRAMGHESITTTARIYAHLYDDELNVLAAALDGLRTQGRD